MNYNNSKRWYFIQHFKHFIVLYVPIIRIMTSEITTIPVIRKSNFPFLALFALICHTSYGFKGLQNYETSLAANVYQETLQTASEVPPKSAIEISDPQAGSVWTVSEPAKIAWTTVNINASKSIRFFLAKDDMVVQELGRFENNSYAEGIELAKNVGSGDNYQVVAIELFPDNKFQVAKYATGYFSIKNPEADARKAAALARRTGGEPKVDVVKKKKRKKRERKKIAAVATNRTAATSNTAEKSEQVNRRDEVASTNEGKEANESNPENEVKAANEVDLRKEFEGRKISYIEELSFSKDEISISLWDHGREDGDIVSIYLNGEPIVSKHFLTYGKKKVSFKLDASRTNDLFLYAHNLGSAPPNTVSVELTDGSTSETIVLNSDLKSCEAVQIKVKP